MTDGFATHKLKAKKNKILRKIWLQVPTNKTETNQNNKSYHHHNAML